MGIQKCLHEAVQRKKSIVMPHLESVEAIQDHMAQHAHADAIPPVSLDMCVMSIKAFNRDWHCTLADKDAAGHDYPAVKREFDELKYREQRKYVFRLTVWRGKKYSRREPDFVEGETAFIKEVTDLKTYNDEIQGTADMDDFMKTEEEEGPQSKKKTKTFNGSSKPANGGSSKPANGGSSKPTNGGSNKPVNGGPSKPTNVTDKSPASA